MGEAPPEVATTTAEHLTGGETASALALWSVSPKFRLSASSRKVSILRTGAFCLASTSAGPSWRDGPDPV